MLSGRISVANMADDDNAKWIEAEMQRELDGLTLEEDDRRSVGPGNDDTLLDGSEIEAESMPDEILSKVILVS